jgi:hypothetical protein
MITINVCKLIKDFYECFDSNNIDKLQKLYDLCKEDCILNGENLKEFIKKREDLFKNGIYKNFYEYEIMPLLFENNVYISTFASYGLKYDQDYYNVGVKIFNLEQRNNQYFIKNVNYF